MNKQFEDRIFDLEARIKLYQGLRETASRKSQQASNILISEAMNSVVESKDDKLSELIFDLGVLYGQQEIEIISSTKIQNQITEDFEEIYPMDFSYKKSTDKLTFLKNRLNLLSHVKSLFSFLYQNSNYSNLKNSPELNDIVDFVQLWRHYRISIDEDQDLDCASICNRMSDLILKASVENERQSVLWKNIQVSFQNSSIWDPTLTR